MLGYELPTQGSDLFGTTSRRFIVLSVAGPLGSNRIYFFEDAPLTKA